MASMQRIQMSLRKSWQLLTKLPLIKSNRVKGNVKKWFNGEVSEKINSRDKLFQKIKKCRLYVDKELFNKAKYEALKLTGTKKQVMISQVLVSQRSWKSFEYLGMPNKTLISNFNAMEGDDTLNYDTQLISIVFKKLFKKLFSNLAQSLLNKLPYPPEKYNFESL